MPSFGYADAFESWFQQSLQGAPPGAAAYIQSNKDKIYEDWKKKNYGAYKDSASYSLEQNYNELNNPNSQYYQNAETSMMRKILDTQPDYLRTNAATGLGMGSAAIAREQEKQFVAKAGDQVSTSMLDMYREGKSAAIGVLGMGLNYDTAQKNLAMEKAKMDMEMNMYNDSKKTSFIDNLLSFGGSTALTYLTGGFSNLIPSSGNSKNGVTNWNYSPMKPADMTPINVVPQYWR